MGKRDMRGLLTTRDKVAADWDSLCAHLSRMSSRQEVTDAGCRCGGVAWGDDGFALLYESWHKTRRSKIWMLAPGERDRPKALLFDRDYEDAYSDPGSPCLRRTHRSTYVIARVEGTGQLIMQGGAACDARAGSSVRRHPSA